MLKVVYFEDGKRLLVAKAFEFENLQAVFIEDGKVVVGVYIPHKVYFAKTQILLAQRLAVYFESPCLARKPTYIKHILEIAK